MSERLQLQRRAVPLYIEPRDTISQLAVLLYNIIMLRLPDIISYRAAYTATVVQQWSRQQIKKFRILCTFRIAGIPILTKIVIYWIIIQIPTGSIRWAKLCLRHINGLSIAKIRP